MQSVGTRLREARGKQGFTLEDINARTRISLKNLAAIEADEVQTISSAFIYRSFVKQVAETLQLDFKDFADEVRSASGAIPEPLVPGQGDNEIVRPLPGPRIRIKKTFGWFYPVAAAGIIVVAGLSFEGWKYLESGGRISAAGKTLVSFMHRQRERSFLVNASNPGVSASTPRNADLRRNPAPAGLPALTQPIAKRSPMVTSDPVPDDSAIPLVSPGSVELKSPPSAQADSSQSVISLPSEADSAIHIELSAIEPTWLSITADGKQTYSGILETAEMKVLDGRESARIRTGNAGGVNVVFNGRALGVLGRHGQTRTFVFTKTGYEVIQSPTNMELSQFSPSGQ